MKLQEMAGAGLIAAGTALAEMDATTLVLGACALALAATLASSGLEIFASTPAVSVPVDPQTHAAPDGPKFDTKLLAKQPKVVYCWDPCTMDALGTLPAMSAAEVNATVARARAAQRAWVGSSFAARRRLLRTMLRFIVENQEAIAQVAVRDSGKTMTDAAFGEILTTCEKLKWTIANGEAALRPERRATGTLAMTKRVRVEWRALGVIGAIVPWNYPFHNVFNPIISALFAGNAIVIKVSEYASWSTRYYGAVLRAVLAAAGADPELVQFVTGYGPTGAALVSSGVDKLIFVGSPEVGVRVMEAASKTLTPVVLELGGKDPFVVCDDVSAGELDRIAQIACRGVYQNMGQNCAGPERFFVAEANGVYDKLCARVTAIVSQMRTGAPLNDAKVDCGAITMGARQIAHYQALVDDAVSKGARVLNGGFVPSRGDPLASGSFYPPTVLCDVPESALIAQKEIFGPIMCIFKVRDMGSPAANDDEIVRMANNCEFALSSCAFAQSKTRARAVGGRLRAGMAAVNDLEGSTYLSQSLPFGGCGQSGFDRFAGPEGLRGLTMPRSCSEDAFDWLPLGLGVLLRTAIPPPLQYPSRGGGFDFASGLIQMFYGFGIVSKAAGLVKLLKGVAA